MQVDLLPAQADNRTVIVCKLSLRYCVREGVNSRNDSRHGFVPRERGPVGDGLHGGQPSAIHSWISVLRQRHSAEILIGCGSRPESRNFHTKRTLALSGLATSRTSRSSPSI
jgi:hypothetical protein